MPVAAEALSIDTNKSFEKFENNISPYVCNYTQLELLDASMNQTDWGKMGTIFHNALVNVSLKKKLLFGSILLALNLALVLFVFKTLNVTMSLQQFAWLSFGSSVILFFVNRGKVNVTVISICSYFLLVIALYLRSQDWVSSCLHCFESAEPVLRSYLEIFVLFLTLLGFAMLTVIVASSESLAFSLMATLVIVLQALFFLLELSASGYWYGSMNTSDFASFFWRFKVRELSIVVFSLASMALMTKSFLGKLRRS